MSPLRRVASGFLHVPLHCTASGKLFLAAPARARLPALRKAGAKMGARLV